MRTKLIVRNRTHYPTREVKKLIVFAFERLELNARQPIVVEVKYTRLTTHRKLAGAKYTYGASGIAYNGRYWEGGQLAWKTDLRIGKAEDFPLPWHDRRGASASIGLLADWREALVAIAAHEGHHIEDSQRGGRRVPTQLREDRCDAYAAKVVKRLRERG